MLPTVIAGILIAFTWAYYPVAKVQYREARAESELSAELTTLEARNARLKAQVARLQTPEGVEDYARSQLGFVKKGERAIIVEEDARTDSNVTTGVPTIDSDETTSAPAGPWTAFLDLVFGIQ